MCFLLLPLQYSIRLEIVHEETARIPEIEKPSLILIHLKGKGEERNDILDWGSKGKREGEKMYGGIERGQESKREGGFENRDGVREGVREREIESERGMEEGREREGGRITISAFDSNLVSMKLIYF